MTASGTVDDYTADVQAAIVKIFATAAGIAESRVSFEVTAASVNLAITIESSSKAAAETVNSNLGPSLASADAAAALMPPGVMVISTPTIVIAAAREPELVEEEGVALGASETGGTTGMVIVAASASAFIASVVAALLCRRALERCANSKMPGTALDVVHVVNHSLDEGKEQADGSCDASSPPAYVGVGNEEGAECRGNQETTCPVVPPIEADVARELKTINSLAVQRIQGIRERTESMLRV